MVVYLWSASAESGALCGSETEPEFEPEPLWRHLAGDQLRLTRTERGETLADVARRAGVSPQYLSEVERGRKEASSEVLRAIMSALDLTLLDLTGQISRTLTMSSLVSEPVNSSALETSLRHGGLALVA